MSTQLKAVLLILAIFLLLNSCAAATKGMIVINNELLRNTITQLANPRILRTEDIKDEEERTEYVDMGYAFVVKGDFNKDRCTDYAVVGKYDGPYPNESIFISILSIKGGRVSVEFLHRFKFPHDVAFLRIESDDETGMKNVIKQFDVLVVAMRLWTDYAFVIAWDGTKYVMTSPEYKGNKGKQK
jgi:hypothetical protein